MRFFLFAIAIKTLALPKAFDASLASRSAEKQMLRDAPPAELAEKLLHHFSAFQVQNAVGMLCILKLDIYIYIYIYVCVYMILYNIISG